MNTRAPSVDWVTMLEDLRRLGFSSVVLGKQMGINGSVLRTIRTVGTSPNHSNGEQIIAFWCRALDRTRDQVPMTVKPLSAADQQ